MMSIWKFPLEIDDKSTLEMPRGAKILCLQVQKGRPCIWAIVEVNEPLVTRRFSTYGTGQNVPYPAQLRNYVGTYQLDAGSLVFHVFEDV